MSIAGPSREADAARDAVLCVVRTLAAAQDDPRPALDGVARCLATTLGDLALIALLSADRARLEPAAIATATDGDLVAVDTLDVAKLPVARADDPHLARLLGADEPIRWPADGRASFRDQPGAAPARVLLGDVAGPRVRELLAAPLCALDGALGIVALARSSPERSYGDADTAALRDVAAELGRAIEHARLRERVRSLEAALHDSEARYRLLSAAAFEGITVHERGQHVDTNEAFAALLGYTRDEIIQKSAWDLAAPESRPVIQRHIASHSEEPYEIVGIRKDGTRIDLEVRGRTLLHDGRHLRVAALRDITDRKRAERELRESRDQLDIILRGVTDRITVQGPDLRLIYANDAAARPLGYATGEDLVKAPHAELQRRFQILDEAGRPLSIEQSPNRRALKGEAAATEPIRYRNLLTGEERWSLLTSTPVFDDAGAVRFIINIFRDITEAKRVEARLRFLADAGALLPSSLSVHETLVQVARVAATTLADWSAAYVVGADEQVERVAVAVADPGKQALADRLLRHPSTGPRPASGLWGALRTGRPRLIAETTDYQLVSGTWDAEHLEVLRALGVSSELWMPLVARGRTVGALALFRSAPGHPFSADDFTVAVEMGRRAALAVDNARLYEEAQQAIEARDVFLSIAAHELRTPVTVLKGMAQMLARARELGTLDSARLERSLQAVADASDRLSELTDDLLDVARLRTDRLEIELRPLDIGAFIREVADRYRDHLTDRHRARLRTEDGLIVLADAHRLEQVLANLLTNAVKYSPNGGEVWLCARGADGGALLEVQDSGIGLPPGSEEAIFQPFERAPNAAELQIPGMGLGLHIARGIVERHGGRIRAESPGPNRGTTLRIWLPLAPPGGEEPVSRTTDRPARGRSRADRPPRRRTR
ncbi:MAG: PAS domain S-box protein [Chloroflexota bacterium]|nr:PAS domain S-box protein [Chloroflexota bacterium]